MTGRYDREPSRVPAHVEWRRTPGTTRLDAIVSWPVFGLGTLVVRTSDGHPHPGRLVLESAWIQHP